MDSSIVREKQHKADIYVGNSLIDMYSKCGCIMKAFEVFGKMEERDTLTRTSIIFGLATHRFAESALKMFDDMLVEGFQPNNVIFLGGTDCLCSQWFGRQGSQVLREHERRLWRGARDVALQMCCRSL